MNSEQFRHHGKDMVDYICKYLDNVGERRVIPDLQPGYMRPLVPEEAPRQSESWGEIMEDVERVIMPGVTHWQHPRFHAYFPAGNSFPSIMGDMLGDAIGCIGFSWAACPALTELEVIVTDWLAKMMGLPDHMLHSSGNGGGVLQNSASDSILVAMLTARFYAIENFKASSSYTTQEYPNDACVLSKLVAYTSKLAHSCVEKAGMVAFTTVRQLSTDDEFSLRGATLAEAIEEDVKKGNIPFFVSATIGTTACCSFDNLEELAAVCKKYNIWLHVDAAYGGNSLVCPEFRHLIKGVEVANSFNFNPNKWLLTNFDISVLWMKSTEQLTRSMIVNPVYLQHKHENKAIDFRHWGIPLSRRFRALKLWFVIRSYGIEGLQAYIRNHVKLAKEFESHVLADDRFEIIGKVTMGLVCFRIKSSAFGNAISDKGVNSINQCLIRTINESGKLHMIPSVVKDKYFIRFCVCAEKATSADIDYAWNTIHSFADEIIHAQNSIDMWRRRLMTARIDETCHQNYSAATAQIDINNHNASEAVRRLSQEEQVEVVTIDEEDSENEKLSALALSEKDLESDEENELMIGAGDTEGLCTCQSAYGESSAEEEEEEDEEEGDIFVCESDLGVGVAHNSTLTKLRRQTLLKMISDPAVYNRRVLRSLCFCSDHREHSANSNSVSSHYPQVPTGVATVIESLEEEETENQNQLNGQTNGDEHPKFVPGMRKRLSVSSSCSATSLNRSTSSISSSCSRHSRTCSGGGITTGHHRSRRNSLKRTSLNGSRGSLSRVCPNNPLVTPSLPTMMTTSDSNENFGLVGGIYNGNSDISITKKVSHVKSEDPIATDEMDEFKNSVTFSISQSDLSQNVNAESLVNKFLSEQSLTNVNGNHHLESDSHHTLE